MNHRPLSLLATSALLFGFGARQTSLPSALTRDFERLTSATSLRVSVDLRIVGEAPVTYQISFAKPNLYRVDGPDGFVLCDGHLVYTYDKAKNSYFEAPADTSEMIKLLQRPEVFGWTAFFAKDPAGSVLTAKAMGNRAIKGNPTSEVEFTLKYLGIHGVLYLDQKLGVPRGYELSTGGKNYLAIANQIHVGNDAVSPTEYAFAAPDGATKTEAPKPDAPTFANVQAILNSACMPCHSAGSRSGGVDLSTYAGVTASVRPGDGANSPLVTVLRTPGPRRMPMGRSPLPETQISQIQKWVDEGAKNN